MDTKRRKDTDTDEPQMDPEMCMACRAPEPNTRTAHQFALVKEGGIDLLRLHLYRFFAQAPRITTEERREKIESVCGWMGGLISQWSGFVDETTGAPLPWYEARRQFSQRKESVAKQAYDHAPEPYKAKHPYEGGELSTLPEFIRLPRDIETIEVTEAMTRREPAASEYLPEPGEYTQDPEETTHADC